MVKATLFFGSFFFSFFVPGHLVFIVCVALVDKELVERKTEAETEEFEQKWIYLSPTVFLLLIVDFGLNMNTTFIINATTRNSYRGSQSLMLMTVMFTLVVSF